MVRTFGFTHAEVMKMSLRLFWFYDRQVDRVRAEEDLRLLRLLSAAQSGEAMVKEIERLTKDLGTIRVTEPIQRTIEIDGDELDPEFDRAALHALRGKVRKRKTTSN